LDQVGFQRRPILLFLLLGFLLILVILRVVVIVVVVASFWIIKMGMQMWNIDTTKTSFVGHAMIPLVIKAGSQQVICSAGAAIPGVPVAPLLGGAAAIPGNPILPPALLPAYFVPSPAHGEICRTVTSLHGGDRGRFLTLMNTEWRI
jgi:hypothetical protein